MHLELTDFSASTPCGTNPQREAILMLGLTQQHTRDLGAMSLPKNSDLYFASSDALQSNILTEIAPTLVVSPLITSDFDAIDIAKRLAQLHFAGQFRVISTRLPRPDIVLEDLSRAAPQIDLNVLVLPDTGM